MSIEDGMISYPKTRDIPVSSDEDEEDSYSPSSEIIGIYGINGSGKSAMVSSLQLLFSVLGVSNILSSQSYESIDWATKIRKGADAASFEYSFQIFHDDPSIAVGTFNISFSMKKDNDDICLFNEKFDACGVDFEPFMLKTGKDLSSYTINKLFVPLLKEEAINPSTIAKGIKMVKENMSENVLFLECFMLTFKDWLKEDIEFYSIFTDFLEFLSLRTIIVSDDSYSQIRKGFNSLMHYIPYEGNLYPFTVVDGEFFVHLQFEKIERHKRDSIIHGHIKYISNILNTLIPDITVAVKNDSLSIVFVRDGQEIPYSQESYGIRKLFSILLFLSYVMRMDFLMLVIDELDEGIFEYLLGNILSAVDEYGRGQLIFTAHNLIPTERLEKKSIWFTTNDPKRRFVHISNLKIENNLREIYFKELSGKRNATDNLLKRNIKSEDIAEALKA